MGGGGEEGRGVGVAFDLYGRTPFFFSLGSHNSW